MLRAEPQAIQLFSKVRVAPAQFLKLRNRVDSIEGANSRRRPPGARRPNENMLQFHRTRRAEEVRECAVVTEGTQANGDLSNLATTVPLEVPVGATDLAAVARAKASV